MSAPTELEVRREDSTRPYDELTRCWSCDRLAWRIHHVPLAACDDCARRLAAERDAETQAGWGSMW